MLAAVVSGLVTGWAIAVPIGAVGAFLVTVASRAPWRTGAAAALGIATVDGAYALVAVVAGSALATLLAPVAAPLRLVAGGILLVVAGLVAWKAVCSDQEPGGAAMEPRHAYTGFVVLTAVNPTTVVYFAAVVLGNRHLTSTPAQGAAFVLAAFVASASWQLLLAGAGRLLAQVATGRRARLLTGLVSAAVVAGLAVHTMASP